MSAIKPEAQAIIDRIKAVDYSKQNINKDKIQEEFNKHLEALNFPKRDIVLVDFREGLAAARAAARDAAWDAAWAAAITNSLYDHPKFKEFKEIWMPFTEAYESGLFCYWVLKDKIIAVKRPVILIKDNRLHADGSPAVYWNEKEKFYFLNGVKVPEYLAMTPESKLDIEFFKKEKNSEVRAQFIRKFGIERMKSFGESKEKNEVYELIDMSKIFSRSGYTPYLFMVNPSTGTIHAEGVHPDCKTIQEALNWRNKTEEKPEVLT